MQRNKAKQKQKKNGHSGVFWAFINVAFFFLFFGFVLLFFSCVGTWVRL